MLACGGGNSSSTSGGDAKGQQLQGKITLPVDTSANARKGGIYQYVVNTDETNLDPFTTTRGAGSGGVEKDAYQKLLKEKEFAGGSKTQVFEGDAVESYELAPDGLTLTAKLRANNKFDPRPPTNGRVMTTQDVVYSWNKMVASSTYASVLANSKDPSVPILGVTAPDDRTLVYKMAFPWAPLIPGLGDGGPHQIVPVEAEDKFNTKNTIRGSGPWMLQEYQPSSMFSWRKNPGYFRGEVPLMDGFDSPILTEYSARLAQFKVRRINHIVPNPPDLLTSIADSPAASVYKGDVGISVKHVFFNSQPSSPFIDVRMRRAVSLSVDRDLFAEVDTNADNLKKEGIVPDIFLNNNIAGGVRDFWLDPRGKDMQDAAQYFKFDVAEAKKLMAAAGYPNGLDVRARFDGTTHITEKNAAIMSQFMAASGLRLKLEKADYNTVFLPLILASKGNFDGDLSFSNGPLGFSPATFFARALSYNGGTTRSAFKDDGQKKIDSMIEQALKTVDADKYRAAVHDIQREMGRYQGAVAYDYSTSPFTLVWPWVKNWDVFKLARTGTNLLHVWIDESLKN